MTAFFDKYSTLRKLRKRKLGQAPDHQVEQRECLEQQKVLAEEFLAYAEGLKNTFAQLREIQMTFCRKLEDVGLDSGRWPDFPHSSVNCLTQATQKADEQLQQINHSDIENLLGSFKMCQADVARLDELTWNRDRYAKKLDILRAAKSTPRTETKITRNEEKLASVECEHDSTTDTLKDNLLNLTSTQRKEEASLISKILDKYLKVFSDFATNMVSKNTAEPCAESVVKTQKNNINPFLKSLTRGVEKEKEKVQQARLKQSGSMHKRRHSGTATKNPFEADVAALNPFEADLQASPDVNNASSDCHIVNGTPREAVEKDVFTPHF